MQLDLLPVKAKPIYFRGGWHDPSSSALKPPAERSVPSPTDFQQSRAEELSTVLAQQASTAEPRAELTATNSRLFWANRGDDGLTFEGRRLEWQEAVEACTRQAVLKRIRLLLLRGSASDVRSAGTRFAGAEIEESGIHEADRYETVQIDGIELDVARWHVARSQGMLHKWQRIASCGESLDRLTSECGCSSNEYKIGCGHRECPRCRFIRSTRVKRDMKRARISLTVEARRRRCDRRIRERFMTLTIPHPEDMQPAERVRVLYEAWRPFSKWLRKRMKDDAGQNEDLVHYWRMFEWTEGGDGLGHPHFHVWLHSPFLRQDDVHEAWERAVRSAIGHDVDVNLPDIRLARKNVEDELIKYMVKDLSDRGKEFVDPAVIAQVFVELEGRRRRQTSAGLAGWIELFLKDNPTRHGVFCTCCGVAYEYAFGRAPMPTASGPPS